MRNDFAIMLIYNTFAIGGNNNIEKGAETLKHLAEVIDTDKMKAPAFLMVLTGIGQYAYRRPDGVFVVPIGCLKD